jgi:hypothetical protein
VRALPAQPSLYQINTRVWLTALSASLGRRATLDDIPDAELARLGAMGFDWVWLLSVWQTARRHRRSREPIPNGARSFRTRCRTCAKTTSPGPGSPSKTTPSIVIWAALRRWPVCGSGYNNADCG